MIMCFFLFEFFYAVDSIDGFLYIEPSLHLWGEAYWIMVDDHFDVFLDSVANNFIEYFCIDIHKGYWPKILSLLDLCAVLVSAQLWPRRMSWVVFLLFLFDGIG